MGSPAKSRTQLSDFTFTFHFPALEKEMATHASVLAWRIPGTGEPGGLPSVGSHRVGHDRSDLAAIIFLRTKTSPRTLNFSLDQRNSKSMIPSSMCTKILCFLNAFKIL